MGDGIKLLITGGCGYVASVFLKKHRLLCESEDAILSKLNISEIILVDKCPPQDLAREQSKVAIRFLQV